MIIFVTLEKVRAKTEMGASLHKGYSYKSTTRAR